MMTQILGCRTVRAVSFFAFGLCLVPIFGFAVTSPYVTVHQDVPLDQSADDDINGLIPIGSHVPQHGTLARLTDAVSSASPAESVMIGPDHTWAHVTWDLGGTTEEVERRRLDRIDIWISANDPLRKGFHGSVSISRDGEEFWVVPNSRHDQGLSQNSRHNLIRYDFPQEFIPGAEASRDQFPVTNFRYLRLNSRGVGTDGTDYQSRFVEVDAWFSEAPPEDTPDPVADRYRNPIRAKIEGGFGAVDVCADPNIIYSEGEGLWYVTCTADALNAYDLHGDNTRRIRLFPLLASEDLVNWEYIGDVFSERPAWVAANANLWAPEMVKLDGLFHLYYTVCQGGQSAIGVATAPTPSGPWEDKGRAVDFRPDRWQYDPEVVTDGDDRYLFFGSYQGGLVARRLTADGLTTLPETETLIALPGRYEAATVVERDGYWYLFVSATDCCRGALTGYSVFVGRAEHPLGPYVDRDGAFFLDGFVGGTPVLGLSGNRWVGPGHNAVFTDFAGQDWFLYHAIDRHNPYFGVFTKRSLMLDPLDWVDGWPTVRGGLWASDSTQPAPAAQPGGFGAYRKRPVLEQRLGGRVWREDFGGGLQNWHWVRQPAAGQFSVSGGQLRLSTQAADLYLDMNNASVLLRALPVGDWAVETSVSLNVPAEGCCHNHVQGGLVVYGDDDRYLKLVVVSINETRQIEFAKEVPPVDTFLPRYGNTVGAAAAGKVWLRIVAREKAGEEHYTAYSSRDGNEWTRAGTWTHDLGSDARVGLVAMGGSGFNARFDYVEARRLADAGPGLEARRPEEGGALPLLLRARPFETKVIEASDNLIDWEEIAVAGTEWDGGAEILDTKAGGLGRRFYRALRD